MKQLLKQYTKNGFFMLLVIVALSTLIYKSYANGIPHSDNALKPEKFINLIIEKDYKQLYNCMDATYQQKISFDKFKGYYQKISPLLSKYSPEGRALKDYNGNVVNGTYSHFVIFENNSSNFSSVFGFVKNTDKLILIIFRFKNAEDQAKVPPPLKAA